MMDNLTEREMFLMNEAYAQGTKDTKMKQKKRATEHDFLRWIAEEKYRLLRQVPR